MRSAVIPFLIILFIGSALAEPIKIRVNKTSHPLDTYAVEAIKIAISNLDEDYELVITEDVINQSRAVERLESQDMDLMWLATNAEMEERLLPIRFPLLKGLLGHRIFIINAKNQSRFDGIDTFEEVKQLSFGQGQGWPDVEILRRNNLKVVTTGKYNSLFYMVEGGRFDSFPRGVLEPWSEIASRPSLDLGVEKDLVLVYKLPFYLYVTKKQGQLAAKLMEGLERALKNGAFDKFYYSNELVVDALTRSNLSQRKAIHLVNPTLTAATPLDREDYWLDITKL